MSGTRPSILNVRSTRAAFPSCSARRSPTTPSSAATGRESRSMIVPGFFYISGPCDFLSPTNFVKEGDLVRVCRAGRTISGPEGLQELAIRGNTHVG